MSTNGNAATGRLNLASFTGLAQRTATGNANESAKQEDAEFWVNIGYPVQLPSNVEGEEPSMTFVSLARGIPLDHIKPFEVSKQRSSNMAALREAQNDIHDAFMAEARKLAPGDSVILFGDENVGLCVQIKRVRGEVEAPAENPLKRTFSFGK